MQSLIYSLFSTPVGDMILGSLGGELVMAAWQVSPRPTMSALSRLTGLGWQQGTSAVIEAAKGELTDYLAGRRTAFDIPVRLIGTPFQISVWNALGEIPFGTTVSYASLAERIGHPRAVRPLSTAVGCNPVSIIVPCHRVVGTDGRLHGYAGGLECKSALLALERYKLPAAAEGHAVERCQP
ncbi:MAG: methylated-DNA--[protein]-cysteine S-methyltransferase [Duncaniella sp.]|nr:methylated-DNA--[protein]-cysteine S-methyltransferase [Duncaniella sp.]